MILIMFMVTQLLNRFKNKRSATKKTLVLHQ
jgi:hypothetical protein